MLGFFLFLFLFFLFFKEINHKGAASVAQSAFKPEEGGLICHGPLKRLLCKRFSTEYVINS